MGGESSSANLISESRPSALLSLVGQCIEASLSQFAQDVPGALLRKVRAKIYQEGLHRRSFLSRVAGPAIPNFFASDSAPKSVTFLRKMYRWQREDVHIRSSLRERADLIRSTPKDELAQHLDENGELLSS